MEPAAVLSVLVTAQGVGPTNAKLNTVQSTLRKTQATADTAGSSIVRSGKRIEQAGAGMTRIGRAATKYYATPLLAAAGAAVYFGQKYEKSMLMVQTHTDTNRKDLALYKREILEMGSSGKYTQGPAELGEAMYHIASDGYKGVEATTMLRKAADLAMVGQAGLAETTYALVSAQKTQIRGTETSAKAINTLNAIVGAGDMKMEDLVGAMSTGILPAAKAMGLSLKDVGVAEDIMTQRGVPAQQAAYRLAMTFQMLIPHTEKAQKAFKSIGLTNMSLINAMNKHPDEGLLAMLRLLHEHLKDLGDSQHQIQTIEEIFGGGRTSRGAITLLQNLDSVEETYGRINNLAAETPKKIAQAKAAPVTKLKEALVQIETVLTKLGSDIIPPLAEGLTWIASEIERVTTWFHSLSPATQLTIMKILALGVAFAILLRIVGFFVNSFGIMVGWFGRASVASAEVVASNEALAASYVETAAAAEASAVAQTEAIAEVAAAQKVANAAAIAQLPIGWTPGQQSMLHAMPAATAAEEAGQLSMLATPAVTKAAATGEGEAAGAAAKAGMLSKLAGEGGLLAGGIGLGKTLLMGVLKGVGIAAAFYAVGNLLTSVFSGDFRDAGFELAGSLIGGVAGFLVGGPAGAMIGAGLGSKVGEAASEWFGKTFLGKGTDTRSNIKKAVDAQTEVMENAVSRQGRASQSLAGANKKLNEAHKHQTQINHKLKDAQQDLTSAQDRYGQSSRQAATAQRRLNRLKLEGVGADRRLAEAEKLTGVRRTAAIRADRNAIANIREKKELVAQEVRQLEHRLGVIQKEPASEQRGQKEKHKEDQISKSLDSLRKMKSEEEKIFASARTQIGSGFVEKLEKINPILYKTKTAAHEAGEGVKQYEKKLYRTMTNGGQSLQSIIDKYKSVNESTKDVGKQVAGPFKNQTHTGFSNAAESAKHFAKTTNGGLRSVGTNMNSMLSAMGGNPLAFSFSTKGAEKTVKKARGGMINIGAPEGDSVPALLEKGEYVMNREAVKKIGVHALNNVNFGKAPRMLQAGGSVDTMGSNMTVGNEPQILNDLYKLSAAVRETVYVISGYRTPQHSSEVGGFPNDPHTRGEAADIGVGSAMRDSMFAIKEAMLKSVGLYRPFYPADPAEVNHVQLAGGPQSAFGGIMGGAGALGKIAVPKIPEVIINGPDGGLKEIGQSAVDKVHAAAQKYLEKEVGGLGGAASYMSGGAGPVMAKMGKILFAHGANKIGAAGIIGNAVGESNLDPSAEGTGGGGLFGFTTPPISLANLKEYAAASRKPWTDVGLQMQFMLEHEGQSMIPRVNAASNAGEAARIFMEDWERPGNPRLDVREAGARAALAAGWQKGGFVDDEGAGRINQNARHYYMNEIAKASKGWRSLEWDSGPLYELTKDWNTVLPDQARMYNSSATRKWLENKLPEPWNVDKFDYILPKALTGKNAPTMARADIDGFSKSNDKEDPKKSSIEKSIKSTMHGIAEGKHLPKFNANLKKIGRRISKIDLGHGAMNRLGKMSNEAEKFGEYASNASAMTRSIENPNTEEQETIQGIFKGGSEGQWLKQELDSLIRLRKQVVTSHDSVQDKTLPRITKLLKHTQKRLRDSQKAIRKDEEKKRELEQKIRDLEKAQNDNIRKLEKEKSKLEDALNKAQQAKNPNHAQISQIRSEIKSKNEAIGGTNKETSKSLKQDREEIQEIEKDIGAKKRVEAASKTLVGQLTDRRSSLYSTMSNLYGQGGEFEGTGLSFYGLEQIQGKGGTTKDIPNPPEFGSVGGEIFDVQSRLRTIQEELEKKPVTSNLEEDTQLKELELEIERDWKKKYLISQSQFKVLSDFPSVGSVASVPYAGAFATGGLVAATVGERGKEVVVMPNGSNVVANHEAKAAAAGMGNAPPINFEELNFYEAEEKIDGRVNGQDFEQEVKKVTRKQARDSMSRTPGGRRRG
jgi:TP901 family phage tail tape measure protein